jgi:ABC-2 type transport system ATP-binding protein
MTVIDINNLKKSYGKAKALNGIDLKVSQGEVYGFIGPNGAGKSTTIRILLGLLRKDEGQIKLLGGDPWKDSTDLHRKIAYVPGDVNLWPNLTGGEVIDLLGQLQGGLNMKRRTQLLERFHLDPRKKCRTYSKGNRQKVAIVSAFSTDAEVYILDEPTSGLDPLMEAVFQECVAEIKKEGKTVLLSSHILAEVEALCDKISIIREGRIIESGTLAELRHLTRNSIIIDTISPITGLDHIPGVYSLKIQGNHAEFSLDTYEFDNILKYLQQFGIRGLISTPPTLEELFMRHYGNELSNGGVKS